MCTLNNSLNLNEIYIAFISYFWAETGLVWLHIHPNFMLLLWTRLIGNVRFLFFSSQLPHRGFSKLKSKRQPTWQGRKRLSRVLVPPHMFLWARCSVTVRIWAYTLPGDTTYQNPTPLHGPGGEILGLGVLKNIIRQIQSASRITAGDLSPVPVKCASATTGFGGFGVFNLLSTLGLILPSLVIRWPHHSSSNGCVFLPFSV